MQGKFINGQTHDMSIELLFRATEIRYFATNLKFIYKYSKINLMSTAKYYIVIVRKIQSIWLPSHFRMNI